MARDIFQLIDTCCWWLNIYGFELTTNQGTGHIRYAIFMAIFGVLFTSECCAIALLDLPHDKFAKACSYTMGHAALIGKFTSVFLKRKQTRDVLISLFTELPRDRKTPSLHLPANARARRDSLQFLILLLTSTFLLFSTEVVVAKTTGELWDPLILWMPITGKLADWIQISMVPLCYLPVCIIYGCLEGLAIVVLVYMEVRFQEVALWLEGLKQGQQFEENLKKVVDLHVKTLECAEQVQYVFGTVYTMQILQSIFMLAFNVIQFLMDRNIAVIIKTMIMVAALLLILSKYTLTAGDVTEAARSVSDAAGACDWAACDVKARKALVLIAVRAQRPLLFRGFGFVVLSHGLFIVIVQRTYSVVALLY